MHVATNRVPLWKKVNEERCGRGEGGGRIREVIARRG
jgi:hypothetical protein